MNGPLIARQRTYIEDTALAHGTQALLIALGGLTVVLAQMLEPDAWLPDPVSRAHWDVAMLGAGLLISIGGVAIRSNPRAGRWFSYTGFLAFAGLSVPGLVESPALALLLAVGAASVVVRIRSLKLVQQREAPHRQADLDGHPALIAGALENTTVVALIGWFVVSATGSARTPMAFGGLVFTDVLALGFTLRWVLQSLPRTPRGERWMFLILPALLVVALVRVVVPDTAFSWLAVAQICALVLLQARRQTTSAFWTGIVEHPARLLVTTFAAIALAGGIVLSLPVSSASPEGIEVIDAFFTSVSATCVNGLTVLDTAGDFSFVGQALILLLIQVGGLGIMTFSTVGVLLLGRRLGMRHESAARGLLNDDEAASADLYAAARRVLRTTFAIEGVGAVLLSLLFWWHGDAPINAVWRGIFTAISAFCSGGFALQSDSMIGYQHDGLLLHTVAAMVILGGLGTPAILAFPNFVRGKPTSLQSKLVYSMTVTLLVLPMFAIAILEWNNTLHGLSVFDKLNNAWFQTVAPRTAGFNSIDYTDIHPSTMTLTVVLMFIGGSPFSTAGGVKTTTVALLWLGVVAAIRGRTEATAFGRRVSHESIYKSIAIMTMSSLFVFAGFLAIQVTQELPFEEALFEVVSALGTAGLTIGATMKVDGIGKIILMFCMFAGRVGPITLFLLLNERKREPKWVYPEEKVAVG